MSNPHPKKRARPASPPLDVMPPGQGTVNKACQECKTAKLKCVRLPGAEKCRRCTDDGRDCLSGGLRKPVIPRQGLVNALNAACEIIDHLASATPVTPALVALARDFVKSARESQYERRLDQRELDELLGEIKSSLGDEGGDAMQVESSHASAESYRGPVQEEAIVPMSVVDSGHMPPVHTPAITCYPPDHDQVYEIFPTDISVSRSPPRRTDPMAVANLLANPEPPTMQSSFYNGLGDPYNRSSATLTSDLSYGLLNMYFGNDPAMDWSHSTGSDDFSPFRSASSIVPAFDYPAINGSQP